MKDMPRMEDDSSSRKYMLVGVAAFVVIVIVVAIIMISRSAGNYRIEGVQLRLERASIESGESTFLYVGLRNNALEPIAGTFSVYADDVNSVTIDYPQPELLEFYLLPGEAVERRLNITATSRAIRTDYLITMKILSGNETVTASDTVVLSVKK